MRNKIFMSLFFMAVFSDQLFASWRELKQVDDGLYAAQISDRSLTLVMEKITDTNRSLWQQYARVQNNPRATMFMMQKFPKFSTDGSAHFQDVLFEVDHNKNEIWVAYVTSNTEARHINEEDMADYLTSESRTKTGFCEKIDMYVTIATSPNALISSHMGVSASHEGLERNNRGLSKDLHSFAAEVTLQRNPQKKYMINAPTAVMGSIIASAVPKNAFFAGNIELIPILKRQISELEAQIENSPRKEKMRKTIMQDAEFYRDMLTTRLQLAKQRFEKNEISQEIYTTVKERTLDTEGLAKEFLTVDDSANVIIANDLIEKELKHRLEVEFGLVRLRPYYDLLIAHGPSIISVDGADGKTAKNQLTIFDRNTLTDPWLVIKRGDENYDWIFTKPFEPAGKTFYIAVDLRALANSGKALLQ